MVVASSLSERRSFHPARSLHLAVAGFEGEAGEGVAVEDGLVGPQSQHTFIGDPAFCVMADVARTFDEVAHFVDEDERGEIFYAGRDPRSATKLDLARSVGEKEPAEPGERNSAYSLAFIGRIECAIKIRPVQYFQH